MCVALRKMSRKKVFAENDGAAFGIEFEVFEVPVFS